MATSRISLDPRAPPKLSEATKARLDAMTDEEITAAAESDPHNPPLTDDDILRLRVARLAKDARRKAGLSQDRFAAAFGIAVSRLRDLEQGRFNPDAAMVGFLALIRDDPERARRIVDHALD